MNETTENAATDVGQDTQIKDATAVLAKNRELLSRNARVSEELTTALARVAELEAQIQSASAEHQELQARFADFHIRRPLSTLAKEISPLDDVWAAEFTKHYEVKPVGDDLGIFKDGKRCVVPKGKIGAGEPYKFEARDVWAMLAYDVDDPQSSEAQRWRALMRYFGPTGSGAVGSNYSFSPLAAAPATTQNLGAPAPATALGLR